MNLGHFDDYISQLNGIIPWFSTSSNKTIYQSEIYACYIENRIRLENNIPVRTFYTKKDNGGYEPSRVAYPPNLLLSPPKWPQMIKFCDYYPINISK